MSVQLCNIGLVSVNASSTAVTASAALGSNTATGTLAERACGGSGAGGAGGNVKRPESCGTYPGQAGVKACTKSTAPGFTSDAWLCLVCVCVWAHGHMLPRGAR